MKLYFSFEIENLFSRKETFVNFFCFDKPITKNKFFEFQLLRYSRNLLGIKIHFQPIGTSHAGFSFSFSLFGFGIAFDIRDKRHWDYENWTWEKHD
jgi:hypothetical protein